MKKREKKIVITFHTTTDAMAMERYCKRTDSCSGYDLGRMRTCMVRSAAREGTSFESDGGGGYNSAGCA